MDLTNKPIALFDLDGTLADHDAAARRGMNAIKSPSEPDWVPSATRDAPDHIRERLRLVRSQPGWWESLDRYAPGFEILAEARTLEFECHILTKGPRSASNSWTEKLLWCRRHVPDLLVTVTQDKGLVHGDVLVDDWPPYLERWLKRHPRGLAIVPAHPWNEGFSHRRALRHEGPGTITGVRGLLAAARGT